MATEGKRKRRFIVSIVGVLLVILGVLWITVIFPWLEQLPLDLDEEFDFDGTFTVTNPMAQEVDEFPVRIHREWKANGTADGALLISETMEFKRTDTGEDVSYRYADPSVLAVDRKSRKFNPEVDERGREGYWSPPPRLGVGDSFELYHPSARGPLPAKVVREEDFRGLKVLVIEVSGENIPLGPSPEAFNMDEYLTKAEITMWVEPSSGTVVDEESLVIRSLDMTGLGLGVEEVYRSVVVYAEDTIEDLMDIGRSAHTMLLWFRTVIPWLLIGLGIVMVLIDVLVLPRIQARREQGQS